MFINLIGPAECLFQESYFNLMKSALKPGGIVCSQAGTAWLNLDHVTQTLQRCKSLFPVASYGVVSVPTYPTGQIGFVLGGLNPVNSHFNFFSLLYFFTFSYIFLNIYNFISSHNDISSSIRVSKRLNINICIFQETNFKEPTKVFNDTELDQMNMKYYNDQVHRAAFILPRFITKALDKALSKN